MEIELTQLNSFILVLLIGLPILLAAYIFQDKFPSQYKRTILFFEITKIRSIIFIRFIFEVFFYILDFIHLLILLIGAIFSGFFTYQLFYLSAEVSLMGKVNNSPFSFISANDLFLLFDWRVFAIGAGIIFLIMLSLLFISLKITLFARKYPVIDKLKEFVDKNNI